MNLVANAAADAHFQHIANLVRQRSAIVLEPEKAYLVEARLTPLARELGYATLPDFITALRAKPNLAMETRVIEAMTTNETSFFRDLHPFEALRTEVLPALIAARQSQRTLNIWSAACSSGQEACTMAMILREYFPQISDWQIQIIGTDLSSAMVSRAREGRFNQTEMNRGLPAALLVKYFIHEGTHWVVKPELKKLQRFKIMNLIEPWPPLPRFDIVFLRNVLIYFDMATKSRILANVRRVLAPDGVLLLGGAETTVGLDNQFASVAIGKSVMFKHLSAVSTATGRI